MKRRDVSAELLADVKNSLNITWSDQPTDSRVAGLIAGASVYLDELGGAALDYIADGLPRTLLMEYVRYARDEALDVFENNYRHMLLEMQNKERVKRNAQTSEPSDA